MITEGTGISVRLDIAPVLDMMETECYPSLLLLPEKQGNCKTATIEVERRLTERLIKHEITVNSLQTINRMLKKELAGDPFSVLQEMIATIKEKYLIEDIKEVIRQTEQGFISKLKSSGLDIGNLPMDRLYQVVEVPISYMEYLGNTAIRYRVLTKREVFVRDEGES